MASIRINVSFSDVARSNKVFDSLIKSRIRGIHTGITFARNNAIEEIKQFLDDE